MLAMYTGFTPAAHNVKVIQTAVTLNYEERFALKRAVKIGTSVCEVQCSGEVWLLVSQYMHNVPPAFTRSCIYSMHCMCHPLLTMFCRSGLAPAPRRSSTTF